MKNAMRKRGRKSAGDLTAIPLGLVPRPPAPPGLADQEVIEWLRITGSLPADHLRPEHLPLLEAMVRHVVASRKISEMIGEIETSMARTAAESGRDRVDVILGAADALDKLLKMRDREVRAASSLATRCRCTAQSVHDRTKVKPPVRSGPAPWEPRR